MENTIIEFYSAFSNLDAEKMVKCYHENIVFYDPAFGELKGEQVKNMWRMLCQSQKEKDFVVRFDNVLIDEQCGSAHWEAFYTFGKTGRRIHNVIYAEFTFKDGKIIKHIDNFSLYKWAQQAFGLSGYLIGWTSIFKKKLNQQTRQLLSKFEKV